MQTFNQSFNAEQSGTLAKRGSGHPKVANNGSQAPPLASLDWYI